MQLSRAARIRAVFFLHAISSGGLYSHVAEVQRALHVDAATLGLVFLGFPIGSMLVFLFGSRVLEAAGTKPILIFGITGLPVATALFAVMPTPIALFTFFIGYALFYSLPNMAMNVEADRVEAASPPRPHTAQTVRRLALPTLPILLLVAFTIGPNLLEGSLRNWSVIYMRDSFAAPSWVDTLTLPVFLLAQSIGRLNADGLVTRIGPVRVARALNVSAFIGCAMVVFAPNLYVALAGFLLIGIGVCVSYPLTTSAAARLGDRPSSQNVASLTLAVQVIMLVSPAALGWIATHVSIRATYGVILPAIITSQWLARYLAPKQR